jgi:hypothetical protein
MSNSTIIPRDDTNKLVLLQQLNAQLPNYASALDITDSDLAQLKVGLDWFDYSLKAQDTTQNYTHALVALNPYLTYVLNIYLKTICCAIKNLRVALHLEK